MNTVQLTQSKGHRRRLAIVLSHPIQYFSPWFVHLARSCEFVIKVFYLWDFGVEERSDPEFKLAFRWDIPLLTGYDYELVPNASADPGTHHFRGLDNPDVAVRIAAWQPDAVLLFGYTYVSHLRILLSPRLWHVPFLLRGDSHKIGRVFTIRSRAKLLMRQLIFRRVDAFLAVGEANLSYFRESASTASRVFLAPHFVDNERFRSEGERVRGEALTWRRDLGIDDDAIVFGFVGKFDARKRPLDLLAASERLQEEINFESGSKAAFLFVGSGQQEGDLKRRAGDRIGRDVFFAPFHNQSQMPRVYAAIDMLVLPSGHGETWGLCVNEAMNLGVPAIVSDRVGCGPDLILPGQTGWIFEACNIESLRCTLRKALEQTRRERHVMREAVRRRVAAYSVEAASATLREAVDWATSRRRSRHAAPA